jgi:hypothetical protein
MATRDISTAIQNNLEDDVVYPFFAVELLFDGSPLRLWTGLGTLVFDGNSWAGTGNLLDVSSVEETSEIAVRGATLTLSGVPTEVISLALSEPYQGRVANVYFGMFSKGNLQKEDGAYILLEDGGKIQLELQETGLTEIFSGYMDEMNIDEGPETSTIELKVENKLIDLERARVRRFTSGYQKSVYPGDKGLDFVESLQDKEVVWGRKVDN